MRGMASEAVRGRLVRPCIRRLVARTVVARVRSFGPCCGWSNDKVSYPIPCRVGSVGSAPTLANLTIGGAESEVSPPDSGLCAGHDDPRGGDDHLPHHRTPT
ncbi:hypothetical protein GW17_00056946 [Ensete ventricosum]|nr:hypothetical protein GW17_00056946 [Ensete ventricosum]RZR95296.1 hypothetical protein BHM03_00024122 [Ensete ventricosum]